MLDVKKEDDFAVAQMNETYVCTYDEPVDEAAGYQGAVDLYQTFGFAVKYGLYNSPLQISEIRPMSWADDNGVSVGDNVIFVDVFDIPEYDGPLDGGDLETLFELQRPLNMTFRRLGAPR